MCLHVQSYTSGNLHLAILEQAAVNMYLQLRCCRDFMISCGHVKQRSLITATKVEAHDPKFKMILTCLMVVQMSSHVVGLGKAIHELLRFQ